jgi:D-alanyl-D-alanine carboxypeptidase
VRRAGYNPGRIDVRRVGTRPLGVVDSSALDGLMEQGEPSDTAAARSELDRLVRVGRVPGAQYLVVGPDRTLFEHASGWADLEACRPMTCSTTMMAYSMSKTITAAAVLQLVEARKVNLDGTLDLYLDSQPYGAEVTVRELLAHTSGIPSPIPLRWVHPAARHDTFDEKAALAKVLAEHPRLTSPPGAKYLYSNIGYWLIGSIVERASGEAFPSYVREHVLQPLGITPRELAYVVPSFRDHAKGYLEKYSLTNLVKRLLISRELIGGYEGRWLHIRGHYVNGAAFGGLVGTARGVGKFLQDQLRPHSVLFGDATRELFFAPQRTTRGVDIPMTLGWHIGALEGVRLFYKEGGGGGFHSMMRLYPSSRIATVLMTNATVFDVGKLLDGIDLRFVSRAA